MNEYDVEKQMWALGEEVVGFLLINHLDCLLGNNVAEEFQEVIHLKVLDKQNVFSGLLLMMDLIMEI